LHDVELVGGDLLFPAPDAAAGAEVWAVGWLIRSLGTVDHAGGVSLDGVRFERLGEGEGGRYEMRSKNRQRRGHRLNTGVAPLPLRLALLAQGSVEMTAVGGSR